MVNVGCALGYLDLDTSKFKQGFKSALDDLKVFEDATATTSQKAGALGSAMSSIGSNLTKSVTLPLVGVGTAAAGIATQFDYGTKKFGTLVDTNIKSVDEMSQSVLDLSSDVGMSAVDLTEALYQTLSATNDTENAMKYLESASKLAKGGFTDVTTAVDGVTSIMNAYGETGEAAFQKIADMMITTQNLGKTTVGELSTALFNVAPMASAAGVSFDQVSAALATMTAQGTPTSVATTQLRTAIQSFVKPNAKMVEALEETTDVMVDNGEITGSVAESYKFWRKELEENVKAQNAVDTSTKEGQKQLKGLESDYKAIRKGLDAAIAGSGKYIIENKGLAESFDIVTGHANGNNAMLGEMVGSVEGLNSVLQLTSEQGMTKYTESLEAMKNSSGESEKAYQAMAESAKEQMNKLKAILEKVAIQIGNIILPIIVEAVQGISKAFENFSKMDEDTQKLIVTIAGIAAAVGPVLMIVGKLFTVFSTISGAIAAAGGASAALGGILTALTGPIGWIIGGIAALAVAFATDFGGIRTAVMGVVDEIRQTLTVWFDWLKLAWDNNLGGIQEIVAFWLTWLKSAFETPILIISSAIKGLFQLLRGDFEGFGKTLDELFKGLGDIFVNFVDAALGLFGTSWNGLIEGAAYAWDTFKETISNAIQAIHDFIFVTIPEIITSIIMWFSDLPHQVGYWLGQLIVKAQEFGALLLQFFTTKIPEIINDIIAWFAKLPSEIALWLSRVLSDAALWGKNLKTEATTAATGFWNSIIEKVKTLPAEFKKWLDDMISKAKAIPSQMLQVGKDIIDNLWDGMKDVWDSVTDWFDGVLRKVKEFFRGIKDGMDDAKDAASDADRGRSTRSYSETMLYSGSPVAAYSGASRASQPVAPIQTGGDTFNFYSPEPLTPVESAREMTKAKQQMALGFI